jgi:peptidoglycan hydrolase CwlO-like protein
MSMHGRSVRLYTITRIVIVVALVCSAAIGTRSTSLAAPTRSDLAAAKERLQELEADFETVVEKYNAVSERLGTLQSEIGQAETKITDLSREMSVKQEAAAEVASELYKGGGTDGIESVLSSESLADAEDKLAYLESSEQAHAKVFEELAVDRGELEASVEQLEAARAAAARARSAP